MTGGALLFARFAYPPNALGYCGTDAAGELLERTAAGADDDDLRRLARGFEGAWPYLELIAHANGIVDPLDAAVVEAYWVGNPLLDRVGARRLGDSLDERFRSRTGPDFARLVEPVLGGAAVPHHAFHVLAVYPWVGLLRSGSVDAPLRVLDRCRVRWGTVEAVAGDRAVVRSRPLQWDGVRLCLGVPRAEEVRIGERGFRLVDLEVGDRVACHWDWACARLDGRGVRALQARTYQALQAVAASPHPGTSHVLG